MRLPAMPEKTETASKSCKEPRLIGWKETIDIPEWGLYDILSKTDTGARRSAIDVKNIVERPGGRVQFDVALDRRDPSRRQTVVAPIARQSRVRSSNGQTHERYVVEAIVRIGHVEKPIELSLVCRRKMICRILLGRKAIEGDFVVDPSLKYQAGPRRPPRAVAEP